MSPISPKKLLLVSLLAIFLVGGTSEPTAALPRADPNIRKTTQTKYHVIDWVPIESQGKVAHPPPPRTPYTPDPKRNASQGISELQEEGAELGPPGTVPIPRVDAASQASITAAKKGLPSKQPPKGKSKRQYAGDHWYVSSNEDVNNLGGSAVFSLYDAYVAYPYDFSLLQIAAVTYTSTNGIEQTVEAGWINYPYDVERPHLFTYYTTVGYQAVGNTIGGWERNFTGWVQYSSTIFPGTVYSPLSVIGGAQYEIPIEYLLYEGNWWLSVQSQWIGYYPGYLFSENYSGQTTLATGADSIFFYGEVYQTNGPLTYDYMGSGVYAADGWPYAAYIHNMVYTTTSGGSVDFTAEYWESNPSMYTYSYFPESSTTWGSYVYLGGPGAAG